MNNDILFSEKQRFKQWWVWLILIAVNGAAVFALYYKYSSGKSLGNNPMSNTGLSIMTGILLLFTLLFYTFRLETFVRKDGIHVRFFPFHFKLKHFRWEDMDRCYIRKYAPIREYGGWGLRLSLWGNGWTYNVSGNNGLQLEMKDNKKLLIGTNKPEELIQALKKMNMLDNENPEQAVRTKN